MPRSITLIFGFLLIPVAVCAQTNSTDSQTVQAVLAEVRQIRQDVEASTAAAQRTQILLYRLQAQQFAVGQATQRLDNARAKLAQTQADRKRREGDAKRGEEFLREHENSPERKEVEVATALAKADVVALGEEEQQWQARQAEAEEQLRIEQEKLGRLQDRLDRLEQSLETPRPR